MDTEQFLMGPSSAILDGQLFPAAQLIAILPPAAPYVMPSAGAGSNTLPGYGTGGAAQNAHYSVDGTTQVTDNLPSAPQGNILGLPSLVFGILAVIVLGYLFLWKVHFE